jgi:ribonuclease E
VVIASDAGQAPPSDASTDEPPAKPKRARRRKADVEAVPDLIAATEAEGPGEAVVELPVEVTPKPPRKRPSKAKAAELVADDVPLAAVVASEAVETDVKPKRAPRKPKAEAPEAASAAATPPQKPARRASKASQVVVAEPVAETAVAVPDAPASAEVLPFVAELPAPEAPTGPPKKGWWQRTFG